MTCQELGLPLVREDWGSGFRSTQEPAFLALNPNGLVPVLIDGERALWESNTICRYLAGRKGAAIRCRRNPVRVRRWRCGWTGRPPI